MTTQIQEVPNPFGPKGEWIGLTTDQIDALSDAQRASYANLAAASGELAACERSLCDLEQALSETTQAQRRCASDLEACGKVDRISVVKAQIQAARNGQG